MIAGEKVQAVGQDVLGTMGEPVGGFLLNEASLQKIGQIAVEGDLSQTDNDPDAREGFYLPGEVSGAVTNLLRRGFIAGRGTSDNRGDPGMTKFETVVARGAGRLAGESQFVEDRVHEVARAVAGEGAACAIGSVGAWGQTEDEDASARVAEAGDGTSPIGLILVGAAFGLSYPAAILPETGTELAANDGFANLEKSWGR